MSKHPEPTVLHGPSLDRDWDSLDPISGYNIIRITEQNAAEFGYPDGDCGLKVRYLRRHLADATDLAEAAAIITAEIRRWLVLVAEPQSNAEMWEPALTEPDGESHRRG